MFVNILLGVTGSVAAILTDKLVAELEKLGEVKVIFTDSVYHFNDGHNIKSLYSDKDEWETFKKVGDPILHIELRKWADVFLIAPCTANTIGKIANGLCDNLLTNTAMAWDYKKPLVIAPACNTYMWDSLITKRNISVLTGLGVKIISPVEKTLACGDTGVGAMAPISSIVFRIDGIRQVKRVVDNAASNTSK
jgi:phosphopantothenoylcysteine decarboxylase